MTHPFFTRPLLSRRTYQHPAGHITGAKGAGCEPLLAAHQALLSYSAGARSHATSKAALVAAGMAPDQAARALAHCPVVGDVGYA